MVNKRMMVRERPIGIRPGQYTAMLCYAMAYNADPGHEKLFRVHGYEFANVFSQRIPVRT